MGNFESYIYATNCSIVCGNAANNKHQKKGDDDLDNKRLKIGSSRHCSKEILFMHGKNTT